MNNVVLPCVEHVRMHLEVKAAHNLQPFPMFPSMDAQLQEMLDMWGCSQLSRLKNIEA